MGIIALAGAIRLNSRERTTMRDELDTRLKATRERIAARIRPVCADMSEEAFETLVTRMALIEWKHAQEDHAPLRRMTG